MFLNELDSRFNNDVVEKAFHNSLCGILCVKIETSFLRSECFDPGVNKAPTDKADLADQFFQLVTLSPALPSVRSGILPRLSLDLLRIGLLEESRELSAELREMIK